MTTSKYETDFYTWANEQAALVRAGRFDEVDIENRRSSGSADGKSPIT